MLITHFGHACVLVELDGTRALIDPGAYSAGFDDLTDIDLVLITHAHADHLAAERLEALLRNNQDALVVTTPEVVAWLPEDAKVMQIKAGEDQVVGGLRIEAVGEEHDLIHPLVPNVANTGFVLGGRVWHPGDSLAHPPRKIDVLLLPVGGPWMQLADAIDFERAVAPSVCIPIHEAGLSKLHQSLHYQLLANLAPDGTTFVPLERLAPTEF